MTMKRRNFVSFLFATVASVESATTVGLENARLVRKLTSGVDILPEHIFDTKRALTDKIIDIQDAGDDKYSEQVLQELAGASAAVDSQIEGLQKQFDFAKIGKTSTDENRISSDLADQAPLGRDHGRGLPNGDARRPLPNTTV